MIHNFEFHVNGDSTLRYLIRESTFDYNKLDHQVKVRCAAINIAIGQWLDINYPTK